MEPQSETVWRQADKYGVPRIAYINKMDRVGADFYTGIKMIKERLGANPIAIQMPIGMEDNFSGIIDLIRQKAIIYHDDLGQDIEETDVPPELAEVAKKMLNTLIEAVAEADEDLMLKYLEDENLSAEDIIAGLPGLPWR